MGNNHTPSHRPHRLGYEPHRKLSSDEPDQGDDSSYPPPAISLLIPGSHSAPDPHHRREGGTVRNDGP